jgi:hypothetical protein
MREGRPVNERARYLIGRLELQPHPEGGYYREVFRSGIEVSPPTGTTRSALSTIYFLLPAGERTRLHRLVHDEAWHFYEGDPLELLWLAPDPPRLERRVLAPVGADREAVITIPAGCWQAARSTGEYSLVGCTVGPGFEFEDFELLWQSPTEAAAVCERFPELAGFI